MLLLSALLLSGLGGNVEWFSVMAIFAVPPILAGPRNYRIGGVIALVAAAMLISNECKYRKQRDAKIRHLQELSRQQELQQMKMNGEQETSEGHPEAGRP